MTKRAFDIAVAAAALIAVSPVLLLVLLAVWLQDFRSPLYIAPRMARGGGTFCMIKVRSMVVSADKSGVNSTAANDRRITPVGRFVRTFKIDELTQLWNVLAGDMSLVGPRPQVRADAELYTDEEKRLLTVRPGITDPASIVFSDEGRILEGSSDPDLLYNQIIRPWKSRLALLYLDHASVREDLVLIALTAVAIISKQRALEGLQRVLARWGADESLRRVALRQAALRPFPPPGAVDIVAACR
jgi:lipopolysaccharide/colanic/teichoic acid biosynthesis glycosyltransferase